MSINNRFKVHLVNRPSRNTAFPTKSSAGPTRALSPCHVTRAGKLLVLASIAESEDAVETVVRVVHSGTIYDLDGG